VLGADEDDALFFDAPREGLVFAEEAVARMQAAMILSIKRYDSRDGDGPMCTASSASSTWRASRSASE
jgi:hypothetical protein